MSIIFRNTDSNNVGETSDSLHFADDRSAIFYHDCKLAVCPEYFSRQITDASVTFVPENQYYYLFITYGISGKDSHIRVGRSREISGPYVDPLGQNLADSSNRTNPSGFLFLSSFSFDEETEISGPSHGYLGKNGGGYFFSFTSRKISSSENTKDSGEATGISSVPDSFPVIFSDDDWPLICPGTPENDVPVVKESYTLKEIQGFYECVSFLPSIPQEHYSSNFVALLPTDMRGIMSMQMEDWSDPIPEDSDGRVEFGGSIRGFYRVMTDTLVLTFAHDEITLHMCTAVDRSNGFPTIFLTGKSRTGIAYMLKKITLPHPNHYFRQ